MKKLVTVVSVLCTGLLVVSPLKNVSYGAEVANNTTPIVVNSNNGEMKNSNKVLDKNSYIDNSKNNIASKTKESALKLNEVLANKNKKVNSENNVKHTENEKVVINNKPNVEEKEQDKKDVVVNNYSKEGKDKQDVINNENKNESKEDGNMNSKKDEDSTVKPVEYISKEQSLNLLKKHLPDVNFYYEGDESTFDYIKDKGLSGYVFLPEVDGDLAYFVDKTTANIYFFHPSGYLELIG